MTTEKQPAALLLAEVLLFISLPKYQNTLYLAGNELRRQHARIAELESQLESIGAGGVTRLVALPNAEPFGYWDRTTHTFVSAEKRKEKFLPDEKSVREIRLMPLYTHAQPAIAPEQDITDDEIEDALKAACMHSTAESRKDMRRAINKIIGIVK